MENIIIAVISHKQYSMPNSKIYVPVEAGAYYHERIIFKTRDNVGDNISKKNPYYCELTGVYWVYKNLNASILGFDHYRRLFSDKNVTFSKNINKVIKSDTIETLLSKYRFILPKKRHYFIETNYTHYIHAHNKQGLEETRRVIQNYYPDYLEAFDKHLKKRSGHYFNMFIGKRADVNAYLDFMFDILFKVEANIDFMNYSGQEKRVFGFISELLLDVYISKNKLSYIDHNYMFMEKQNWPKKVFNFIKRKIKHNEAPDC